MLNMPDDDVLVPIPGLGAQAVALVPSILEAAGFVCYVQPSGVRWARAAVFVRARDVGAVKDLLRDYMVGDSTTGTTRPIPW